jgi:hypothetical protein
MFEFLKTERFSMIASFIVGLGLMSVLKPMCNGPECRILKAPPLDEVNHTTYQLGGKCYQFRSETISCPTGKIIESFEQHIR